MVIGSYPADDTLPAADRPRHKVSHVCNTQVNISTPGLFCMFLFTHALPRSSDAGHVEKFMC